MVNAVFVPWCCLCAVSSAAVFPSLNAAKKFVALTSTAASLSLGMPLWSIAADVPSTPSYTYTPIGNIATAIAAIQEDPEALSCSLDTQQADENHGSCQLLDNVVRWRAGKFFTIRQDWGGSASTGAAVWNGANMAAWYLGNALPRSDVAGSRVLELGAGVGFTSLVAHALGAEEVAITDGNVDVLKLADQNIAINIPADQRSRIYTAQLRWNTEDEGVFRPQGTTKPAWDYIIAADVTYLQKNREDLLSSIAHLSGPKTVALISMEPRNVGEVEDVLSIAEKKGFTWTEMQLPIDREKEQCGMTCARMFALHLTAPPAVSLAVPSV